MTLVELLTDRAMALAIQIFDDEAAVAELQDVEGWRGRPTG
jgi:hypothetical protein